MKLKLPLLLICLTLSSAFAAVNRIYGGSPDSNNKWNSTIAIAFGSSVFCSGAVVEKNLVMTAAHCVVGMESRILSTGKVLFGVGGIQGWTKSIAITKALVHPNYKPHAQYNTDDFAILTLAEDVPSSVSIIPAISSEEAKMLFAKQHLSVVHVGFGVRENGIHGEKYVAESEITRVFEREFEAGLGDGRGTCYGDSGGPTFARINTGDWRLIGVTSRGPGSENHCETYGGIYGRADEGKRWYTGLAKARRIFIR